MSCHVWHVSIFARSIKSYARRLCAGTVRLTSCVSEAATATPETPSRMPQQAPAVQWKRSHGWRQPRPISKERRPSANASCARPRYGSASAARARRARKHCCRLGATQQSAGSAGFQSAALDSGRRGLEFASGHRGNATGGGHSSHDEALVLGAANAIRWHSGSRGTEAIGSPLRNTPAPNHQVGTANRMESAIGLAAAPGQQVRGCPPMAASTIT
jgi:hypothetical protein